jgi:hypothetical protein
VVSCGSKDGYSVVEFQDLCKPIIWLSWALLKEIGLCAQIMITILGFVVNICRARAGRRPI